MPTIDGAFDVQITPAEADDRDGADFLGRMLLNKSFHGELEAQSVGQMLAARGSQPSSAGYVAIERVTGSIGGRRGSFILQHSGHSNPAGQSLAINVIADSGTDELTGLTGSMRIIIEPGGEHFYEFDYTLPD